MNVPLENPVPIAAQDQSNDNAPPMDEFLVMLAHELRNPLTSLCNALEIWQSGAAEEKVTHDLQRIMKRQLQHMVQLVDDLLDVSRVSRGVIILEHEPVDLVQIVNYAAENSREQFTARHQVIAVNLPQQEVRVAGDAVRLKQILCNLLVNAAKYTPPHGHIAITLTREAECAVIRVVDDGVGIAAELLPQVFFLDRFVRSQQSLDRQQGGLGLGLTLVRRLVEMHGGTVTAQSLGLKQGSAFVVRLPLMTPGDVTLSVPVPVTLRPTPTAGLRILVIEDDADSAKTTQMLLELQGYQVQVAFNGAAGIESAKLFKPNVILLDIGLPGMNGYEVAQRLRQLPATHKTMLIALSGYGQVEDIQKSAAAGFDHHLVKPADTAVLQALLAGVTTNPVTN
jgi:two-component system CheB/CheR fusion protein